MRFAQHTRLCERRRRHLLAVGVSGECGSATGIGEACSAAQSRPQRRGRSASSATPIEEACRGCSRTFADVRVSCASGRDRRGPDRLDGVAV